MREVQQNQNGGAKAGQEKAGAAGAGAGAGAGAANESVRQQGIKKWEGGGDVKDLRSLKRSEDEVRSVTR